MSAPQSSNSNSQSPGSSYKFPEALLTRPRCLVGLSGLDTINNAIHRLVWEEFTKQRPDKKPISYKNVPADHLYPKSSENVCEIILLCFHFHTTSYYNIVLLLDDNHHILKVWPKLFYEPIIIALAKWFRDVYRCFWWFLPYPSPSLYYMHLTAYYLWRLLPCGHPEEHLANKALGAAASSCRVLLWPGLGGPSVGREADRVHLKDRGHQVRSAS